MLQWLWSLMPWVDPPVTAAPNEEPKKYFGEVKTESEAIAKSKEQLADDTRKRAEQWAKGIAAFGTTAITALGLTNLVSFINASSYPRLFLIMSGIAAILIMVAVYGVTWISRRVASVNAPLVVRASVEKMDLNSKEAEIVREIYARQARVNGWPTLAQYASLIIVIEMTRTRMALGELSKTSSRLSKCLHSRAVHRAVVEAFFEDPERTCNIDPDLRSSNPKPAKITSDMTLGTIKIYVNKILNDPETYDALANTIAADVQAAMQMGLAAVVRERMLRATTSRKTAVALIAIVASTLFAFVLANAAKAENGAEAAQFNQQKSCVEVASTISEKKLPIKPPEACSSLVTTTTTTTPSTPKPDPAVRNRASMLSDAVEAYVDCLDDAELTNKSVCDDVLDQAIQVAGLPPR